MPEDALNWGEKRMKYCGKNINTNFRHGGVIGSVPLPSDLCLCCDIQFSRIPGCEKQKFFNGTHATRFQHQPGFASRTETRSYTVSPFQASLSSEQCLKPLFTTSQRSTASALRRNRLYAIRETRIIQIFSVGKILSFLSIKARGVCAYHYAVNDFNETLSCKMI